MNFFLYELLPTILNMSITGSIVILAVLAIRLLLRKAPKVFSYALWAVVLFRLLSPFSFESAVGIMPSTQPIPTNIVHEEYPSVDLPLPIISDIVNKNLPQGEVQVSADPLEAPMSIATVMWSVGVVVMLIYSVVQYAILKRKLIGAKPLEGDRNKTHMAYVADKITSPFVMGLIKPKIYLPSALPKDEYDFIIAHELCHIKRLDHITRILAFIALALHWFNPLVWVAYIVSAKDMEMSCDEAVMKKMDSDIRAKYSTSLLRLATGKKLIFATPLAFGEGDTKGRVKNVMKYKKPVLWVSVVCLVVVLAVLVGFMSSRAQGLDEPPTIYAYYEHGVAPMNLGSYSWTYRGVSTESDSIHPTEMDYPNPLSYNDGGYRNANIIFSLDNEPDAWNSDNIQWDDAFNIVAMRRYVNGEEEILDDFGSNFILVSLETDNSYIYEFRIEFEDGNDAYYSIKINNNVHGTDTLSPISAMITEIDRENHIMTVEPLENKGLPNGELMLNVTDTVFTNGSDGSTIQNFSVGYPVYVYIDELSGEVGYPTRIDMNSETSNTGDSEPDDNSTQWAYQALLRVGDNIYVDTGKQITELPIDSVQHGELIGIAHGTSDLPKQSFHATNLDEKYAGNPIFQVGDINETVYLYDYSGFYLQFELLDLTSSSRPLQWDLPMMIMVDGKIFVSSGEESATDTRDDYFDGEITSLVVKGSERPILNNQSNFGTGFQYQIINDTIIELEINGTWYVFILEEQAPLELFRSLSEEGDISLSLDGMRSYTFKTHSQMISVSLDSEEQIDAVVTLYDAEDNENSLMQFDLSTGETKTFTNLTSERDYLIKVSAFEYEIRSDVDPYEQIITITD